MHEPLQVSRDGLHVLAVLRGHGEHGHTPVPKEHVDVGAQAPEVRVCSRGGLGPVVAEEVRLVRDDERDAADESGAVRVELAVQREDVVRRAALRPAHVDDVDEHAAALDVPQEVVPEAPVLRRVGDQAGHVGDDEAAGLGVLVGVELSAVAHAQDAEVRAQRREAPRADLRVGAAEAAEERALARVREADEADVGRLLVLERHEHRLARAALQRDLGRAVLLEHEVRVAEAAAAAAREEHAGRVGRRRHREVDAPARVGLPVVRGRGEVVDQRDERGG